MALRIEVSGYIVAKQMKAYSGFTDDRGQVRPGGVTRRIWFVQSFSEGAEVLRMSEDKAALFDSIQAGEKYAVLVEPDRNGGKVLEIRPTTK